MAETGSPYVGLRPFRQEERPIFFGRERDIRVITSNLVNSPLTVLYGASGVGKSSVLQAGVLPVLADLPNCRALYFREWHDESCFQSLRTQCAQVLGITQDGLRLDDILSQTETRFFL